MKNDFQTRKNKLIFGSTSAIITSLALVVGLNFGQNAQFNIIASLLILALADNISDSLGIHIYQEAEGLLSKDVWLDSLTNFLARFLFSSVFILLVIFLPLNWAIGLSIIYGLLIIAYVSYDIARFKKESITKAVVSHLLIAIAVLAVSSLISISLK